MKVFTLVGLIGSGKSTWARKYAKEHPDTKIVSADAFRTMLNGEYEYDEDLDGIITRSMYDTAMNLLVNGYSVIMDCGNLAEAEDRRILWRHLLGTRTAVLFPQKETAWYVANRMKNPHRDVDWTALVEKEKAAFEPINPEDYDEVIEVKEF